MPKESCRLELILKVRVLLGFPLSAHYPILSLTSAYNLGSNSKYAYQCWPFLPKNGFYVSSGDGSSHDVVELVDHFADVGRGVGGHCMLG
jgi:hypothetical protein